MDMRSYYKKVRDADAALTGEHFVMVSLETLRGMREMDLIMGGFADATVEQLDDRALTDFERLIDVPDRDLLAWITGEVSVPPDFDSALFRSLRDFHLSPGGGG